MKFVILLVCAVVFSAADEDDSMGITEFVLYDSKKCVEILSNANVMDKNCSNFNEEKAEAFIDTDASKYMPGMSENKKEECKKQIKPCKTKLEEPGKACDVKCVQFGVCVAGFNKSNKKKPEN